MNKSHNIPLISPLLQDQLEISDEAEVTKGHESEKELSHSNSLEQFTESLDKNLSERVIKLVEEIIAKATRSEEEMAKAEKDGGVVSEDDIQLSIWDFAGQAAYYTTHQVCLFVCYVFLSFFPTVLATSLVLRNRLNDFNQNKRYR